MRKLRKRLIQLLLIIKIKLKFQMLELADVIEKVESKMNTEELEIISNQYQQNLVFSKNNFFYLYIFNNLIENVVLSKIDKLV